MTDTERAVTGLENLRDAILNDYIRETDQAVRTIDDALELLKSKPDIDKIVKELDDTSKQYEPRPFESINWMLRYEGIMIGLEIAQYVVKGEPIPDKF